MPASPETTGKPLPVAGDSGIASIDAQYRKLTAEDAQRRAQSAAKAKAAQPTTVTDVRGK